MRPERLGIEDVEAFANGVGLGHTLLEGERVDGGHLDIPAKGAQPRKPRLEMLDRRQRDALGIRSPAASSASTGNGRSGSTGRRVATGRSAVCIAFSADLTTSQASATGTMRASLRLLSSWSSTTEESPTTPPPVLKTGPPVLPGA